jgi:hypothetical protein
MVTMKKILFTILLSFSLLLLIPEVVHAGFGISPAGITNTSLKKGTQYIQEMTISRSDPDEELIAIIQPDLGEMNGWVTFEPSMNVTLPVGEQRVPIRVIVNVPADAAIKDYKGVFRILASPKEKVKGVSIVKGARVDIKVATTDDSIIELEIRSASIPDVYEKEDMNVTLKIQNNGNTPVAPSKIEVRVQNLLEEEIAILETDLIEMAPEYMFSEVNAIIKNHGLLAGEYYGNIKVFVGAESLYENKVVFKVLPEKVFEEVCTGAPEVISSNRLPIFVGVSLLGLVLTAYYTYREMKSDKKSKRNKKLINLTAFLVFVILMYLVFVQDVIGVMERNCSMELVPPVQNSEVQDVVATNMSTPEPSSSVQGTDTKKEVAQTQTTFDELRIGLTTQDSKYRVYESNSLSSNVIYLAEEGEQFKMIQETAEWYRIELSDGQTGWLPKNSVKAKEEITIPE